MCPVAAFERNDVAAGCKSVLSPLSAFAELTNSVKHPASSEANTLSASEQNFLNFIKPETLLRFSHDYTVCPYPDESSGLLNYVFASVSNRNPSYIRTLTENCYSVSQLFTDPQVLFLQIWQCTGFLIKIFYMLLTYIL